MNKKSNIPLYMAFASVVVLALIVRTFVFNIRKVEGESMSPSLNEGDLVLISMLARDYRPGDVAIFSPPNTKGIVLIKRIAAGPSSKLFIDNYKVIVNQNSIQSEIKNLDSHSMESLETQEFKKPYLTKWNLNSIYCRYSDVINSKNNEYIVLGDNRCNSSDSRVFGAINQDSLIGKAIYTIKLSKLFKSYK
jgi:signal peptidase I